ncbi:hypothetical protein ABIE26_004471 [Pedobacter africanus]|uniref:Uncharacterized protein n=1 Tax=Pedobacter africanus TaxID=151894 RepID=A0ACC6L3X6_9SPHI|nr:hypothetical protein [Pedobacter africanus]MDR6786059.1 hypothetical protein [Pedobacter africanus]
MKLEESVGDNLKSFEEIISSIANDNYDDACIAKILQLICMDIHMEAEISMTLYPDCTRPWLNLYVFNISRYLGNIEKTQKSVGKVHHERLNLIYTKLYRLSRFIEELLLNANN